MQRVILELKFDDRFPTWMRDLVECCDLHRSSMGKYVHCMNQVPRRSDALRIRERMNEWMHNFMAGDLPPTLGGVEAAVLALLVAFCIGHIVAWTYMLTHTGLSYSQMFTSSLLVLPVIVALTMMLLAGNILIALGLLSIFAMIRFRNVLKDTRDTTFILWAVVEGVAAGTQRLSVGVIGAIVVAAVFLYVRATAFGSRHRYDVVVSVQWSGNGSTRDAQGRFPPAYAAGAARQPA